MSVASSQRRGTRWSLYSGGSNTSVFSLPIACFEPLGQTLATTNVRDIPLPIRTDSLFNPWWYNTKIGSPPGATPNRALSMVSFRRKSLESALHEAVKAGDTVAVIRLISQGANIEIIDSEGLRPLIWAVRCDNGRIVRIFLNEGANVNKEGRSEDPGLNRSLGSRAIARPLLNPGSEDSGDEPPLSCSIRLGHGAITEILLDRAGIEEWDGGRVSLHLAVRWGHESIVKLLLDRGADIGGGGWLKYSALHRAMDFNHKAIVELLLDRGADIEARGSSGAVLHRAVCLGHLKIVHLLLDRRANIEGQDKFFIYHRYFLDLNTLQMPSRNPHGTT